MNKPIKLKMKNGGSQGIGAYIRKRVLEMGQAEGVDYDELDVELLKKFGQTKTKKDSRKTSISWHIAKMRDEGIIE